MISILLPVLLLPLALAAPAPSSDYPSPKSCPRIAPPDAPVEIIPKSSLPFYYNTAPASTESTAAILNQLTLTALATDGKNFTALGELFVEDSVAQLAAQDSGFVQGRDAILVAYEKALAKFDTQQSLGTTFAKIYPEAEGEEAFFNPGPCQASTFTYFTTTFFEKGNNMGKKAIAVGDFRDRWVNDNGVWKILLRIQTVTGLAYDGGLDFS